MEEALAAGQEEVSRVKARYDALTQEMAALGRQREGWLEEEAAGRAALADERAALEKKTKVRRLLLVKGWRYSSPGMGVSVRWACSPLWCVQAVGVWYRKQAGRQAERVMAPMQIDQLESELEIPGSEFQPGL